MVMMVMVMVMVVMDGSEMQKVTDMADISVLLFLMRC